MGRRIKHKDCKPALQLDENSGPLLGPAVAARARGRTKLQRRHQDANAWQERVQLTSRKIAEERRAHTVNRLAESQHAVIFVGSWQLPMRRSLSRPFALDDPWAGVIIAPQIVPRSPKKDQFMRQRADQVGGAPLEETA